VAHGVDYFYVPFSFPFCSCVHVSYMSNWCLNFLFVQQVLVTAKIQDGDIGLVYGDKFMYQSASIYLLAQSILVSCNCSTWCWNTQTPEECQITASRAASGDLQKVTLNQEPGKVWFTRAGQIHLGRLYITKLHIF